MSSLVIDSLSQKKSTSLLPNGPLGQHLGFLVKEAGVLSLLQDTGRYGAFHLGLTHGGPADSLAFYWANRLCSNQPNDTAIEICLGGLELIAQVDTVIAVTGAPMPLTINGQPKKLWRSYVVAAGDTVKIGYGAVGVRCYLAVANGFDIQPSFGSTSTVCRERIGGLNGGKLQRNDILPCINISKNKRRITLYELPENVQPTYSNETILRTVIGYQQEHFSASAKKCFFSTDYHISKYWDRMGYRLQGEAVNADIDGILSEGICYGAIQFPGDGQPIILLNDRQTIGGYPKIGAVISQDCAKLTQLKQGGKVHFEAVSLVEAERFHLQQLNNLHNANLLAIT